MAYISTEKVNEIRQELKKLYPSKEGWKFSIVRDHYSEIRVAILQAPIELRDDISEEYENVNEYYIDSRKNKQAVKILKQIIKICNRDNYNNSDSMTDYFEIGYFFNLSIGKWDRPFILKTIEGS